MNRVRSPVRLQERGTAAALANDSVAVAVGGALPDPAARARVAYDHREQAFLQGADSVEPRALRASDEGVAHRLTSSVTKRTEALREQSFAKTASTNPPGACRCS